MADFDNGRFSGVSPKGDRLGTNPVNRGGFFDNSRMGDNRTWGSVTPSTFGATSYSDLSNSQISELANAIANRTRAAVGPAYTGITPATTVRSLPTDIVADVLTAPPNTAINMAPPTMAPPTTVTSYAPTAAPSAAAAAIGGQMGAVGHPGVSYNGPAAPTSGPNAGGNFGLTDLPSLNSMMSPKANIGGILSNMAGPIGGLLGALGMERAGTPAGGYGGILGGLLGRTNSGDGLGGGGPGGRDSGKSGGSSSRGGGNYGGGTNSNGPGRRN